MTPGPHLLGRVAPIDDRHLRAYTLSVAVPVTVEREIKRPTADSYDQGPTPRCVGYSTSKVMNFYNRYVFDADWLYAECKKIDGYPGDGTNARAACDVLRRLGHWRKINGKPVKAGPKPAHGIASNQWAPNVDVIRGVLSTGNPVLLGIDWYNAWFQPQRSMTDGKIEYLLQPIASAGQVAGGHEIGVWAASDRRQAFGLSNTWGSGWPDLAWISYSDVARLLAQGGDACVITDLPTR